jgi:hypothetical protein
MLIHTRNQVDFHASIIESYQPGSPMMQQYLKMNGIKQIGILGARDRSTGYEVWQMGNDNGGWPIAWFRRLCDAKKHAAYLAQRAALPVKRIK